MDLAKYNQCSNMVRVRLIIISEVSWVYSIVISLACLVVSCSYADLGGSSTYLLVSTRVRIYYNFILCYVGIFLYCMTAFCFLSFVVFLSVFVVNKRFFHNLIMSGR